MFDLISYFMSEHGAGQPCVDAWKDAGAELASVPFTALREHWNADIRPNKQDVGNALFIKWV